MAKDDLKMGCENGKLFFGEPIAFTARIVQVRFNVARGSIGPGKRF
jgi:hypothetical protein